MRESAGCPLFISFAGVISKFLLFSKGVDFSTTTSLPGSEKTSSWGHWQGTQLCSWAAGGERSCREEAYIKLFLRNNRKIAISQEGGGCRAALPRADLAHQAVQWRTNSLKRLKSAASISTVILACTYEFQDFL